MTEEMQVELKPIYDAVIDGDMDAAVAETKSAVDAGASAAAVLHEALLPAMQEVGRRFEEGEYFLPEMLAGGLSMKSALQVIAPQLARRDDVAPLGRVVLGTVKGDIHDIGKNLVGLMLEGAGFEVTDLGTDVPRERFLEAAASADIIGLSGLVSTTIPEMASVISALKEAGLRDQVKVMVGGAPVTQEFADRVGADGYAKDAAAAARKAKQLLGR